MTIAHPSTSLASVDGGGRLSFAHTVNVMQIPNLIQVQRDSFKWFQEEGLKELFAEISPIQDFTGRNLELTFEDYRFDNPKSSELECRERDMTFAAPLRGRTKLLIKQTGEVVEQE